MPHRVQVVHDLGCPCEIRVCVPTASSKSQELVRNPPHKWHGKPKPDEPECNSLLTAFQPACPLPRKTDEPEDEARRDEWDYQGHAVVPYQGVLGVLCAGTGLRGSQSLAIQEDGLVIMKIVVTGGAGFIGSNLCEILGEREGITAVVAFDNLATGSVANLDGVNAHFIEGDIRDFDCVRDVVEGAQCVVHLAALPSVPRSIADPVSTHEVNATGTLQVLRACVEAGVSHAIVASSSSVYGANTQQPKTEDMQVLPMSPYAVSKLATEQYALAWSHSYGMKTLAFRFFNVFGPRQRADHAYAAVIPKFLSAAIRNEPLMVYGSGEQSRDFTYVGTVCAVIAEAIQRGVASASPVNLAFGTRTSLLELVGMMEDMLGRPLQRTHHEPRVGDVLHSQADNSQLKKLFPGTLAVDLRDGLRRTLEWLIESGAQDTPGTD